MTGEKLRSLRKDKRPSKDEDLLEPDEEAATGTFAVPKANNKSRASKIFSNHKLIKSPSTQSQNNGNTTNNTLSTSEVIDDNNKNPIIKPGLDFPVHECVFKGDVRRLSSLIRTQNIAQKDVHGGFTYCLSVDSEKNKKHLNQTFPWSNEAYIFFLNVPSVFINSKSRRGFFHPRPEKLLILHYF